MEAVDKQKIRKRMIKQRIDLPSVERHQQDLKIFESIRRLWDAHWRVALIYLSHRTEVSTQKIIQYGFEKGIRICVPSFDSEKKAYLPSELKNLEQELESGQFGIQEPRMQDRRIVPTQDLDVVIVPGLAFDRSGNRLGYGLGYFDGMCRNIRAQKVGLAYHFQIIDNLNPHSNDVAMDFVVTEKEVISCQKP
jgi:5-formyltetrahydrofolate cyclo-ligase